MSGSRWLGSCAKASIAPLLEGTIAVFDVTVLPALRVDTLSCGSRSGHRGKYPSVRCGTTVAFDL